MFGKVLLIAVLGVCSASIFENSLKFSRKDVQRFEIERNQADDLVSGAGGSQGDLLDKLKNALLLNGAPVGAFQPNPPLPLFGLEKPSSHGASRTSPVTLQSFNIKNCSKSAAEKAQFVLWELKVQPDPIVLPGVLNFAFTFNIKSTITDNNTQIALNISKKVGDIFIHIPCIGEFGSCTYDLCKLLSTVQECPQELVKHKIDCKCPFNKGTYNEPGISAAIQVPVFPSGDYSVNATMTSGGIFLGCYTAMVTFA